MEKHMAVIEDIAKLEKKKEEAESIAQKFQVRAEKEERKLKESAEDLRDQDQKFQKDVSSIWEQNHQLKVEKQHLEDKVVQLEQERQKLEAICSSGAERKMVFKGKVSSNVSGCGINVKHQMRYSVRGGTALIVFEEPTVAERLIKKKHHKVAIEDCYINVKAEPIELTVLDALNVDMNRSLLNILVTDLPAGVPEATLLDKLELFFSKTKNGGSEVENTEYLEDSRSAIVTFIQEGVAPKLVDKKRFDVPFSKQETHQVCVSPSVEGNITGYQMKNLRCNRTVLITGIPDIKDEETMNDLLEIHFQKESNAGGEVQKLFYCPEGKNAVVLFEDDKDGGDDPQGE
ncbi:interferon-induced 35 kDa protein isoform X2 [Hyla sarda]|uniref:interferon-induced 35 kDa protein isoform X2 n=1 Tax=Hyla sarda TaxID=327740 RepID=UPI0024C2699F|nr:interferon-induced 35 kDa protein isoform X2 [Hyla sarda]